MSEQERGRVWQELIRVFGSLYIVILPIGTLAIFWYSLETELFGMALLGYALLLSTMVVLLVFHPGRKEAEGVEEYE